MDEVIGANGEVTDSNIEKVSVVNINNAISRMRSESAILNEMEKEGSIQIVGAVYDVASGKVNFL